MSYKYAGTRVDDPTPEVACGSLRGYSRHAREDTPKCAPCKAANAAAARAYRKANSSPQTPFNPSACGTYRGYRRHKARRIDACTPCKAANAEYVNQYRAKRKATA